MAGIGGAQVKVILRSAASGFASLRENLFEIGCFKFCP
jgi:hypothetical protein